MWRLTKWIIGIGCVGLVAWFSYQWYSSRSTISAGMWTYIPKDAVFCISTDDPVKSWKEVSGSATWTHLRKNEWFAQLTSSANVLDSMIRENSLLFDLIGSRALIVSAHMTGFKQYDFLFLVDLGEASGIKFLNDYLTTYTTAGMSVQKEKYKDEALVTIRNPSANSNLYISFPANYLVASFNRKILTSSISAGKDTTNREWMPTSGNTGSGLMTLYLNYPRLPSFVRAYSNESAADISRVAEALRSTVLDVTLKDELLRASGWTEINDSVESYVKTLAVSGTAPLEFPELAPQRTAFALALAFDSFSQFFTNLERNLQHDIAEYNDFRQSLKQVENYLGVDLQENFISWVGDEVAVLELQSYGSGLDNETAILIKATNIEKARADLDHIEKMVRRKTPIKFRAVDYRGYTINYLSMKGLFKVLLGKFFARYDKPYYTVVNNFVIFSGHPQTLESIIDDYLDKQTLNRSGEFRKFNDQFEDESSVLIYLNTPVLFGTMKRLADAETKVAMERNKDYITGFRQMGFQLVAEEGKFRTLFAEQFVEPEPTDVAEIPVQRDSLADANETLRDQVTAPTDPMQLPYIYVRQLNVSTYTAYFPDSTVHFKVDLKNGFKDGGFTEYYQNGEVKLSGHFKDDRRDGLWRLYSENGQLILRRTYEDGIVKRERRVD